MEKRNCNNRANNSIFCIAKDIYDNKILIPDFQRPFLWKANRISMLISSLLSNMFIGAIYIIYDKKDKNRGNYYLINKYLKVKNFVGQKKQEPMYDKLGLVIDGQQRLTVIYHMVYGNNILLDIIKDRLKYKEYYIADDVYVIFLKVINVHDGNISATIYPSDHYILKQNDIKKINAIFENIIKEIEQELNSKYIEKSAIEIERAITLIYEKWKKNKSRLNILNATIILAKKGRFFDFIRNLIIDYSEIISDNKISLEELTKLFLWLFQGYIPISALFLNELGFKNFSDFLEELSKNIKNNEIKKILGDLETFIIIYGNRLSNYKLDIHYDEISGKNISIVPEVFYRINQSPLIITMKDILASKIRLLIQDRIEYVFFNCQKNKLCEEPCITMPRNKTDFLSIVKKYLLDKQVLDKNNEKMLQKLEEILVFNKFFGLSYKYLKILLDEIISNYENLPLAINFYEIISRLENAIMDSIREIQRSNTDTKHSEKLRNIKEFLDELRSHIREDFYKYLLIFYVIGLIENLFYRTFYDKFVKDHCENMYRALLEYIIKILSLYIDCNAQDSHILELDLDEFKKLIDELKKSTVLTSTKNGKADANRKVKGIIKIVMYMYLSIIYLIQLYSHPHKPQYGAPTIRFTRSGKLNIKYKKSLVILVTATLLYIDKNKHRKGELLRSLRKVIKDAISSERYTAGPEKKISDDFRNLIGYC